MTRHAVRVVLSASKAKLGATQGLSVFNDLREQNDSEAPTTLQKSFPYGPLRSGAPGAGNAVVDDASVQAPSPLSSMSNAMLISAKRSATGHPFMVAGPQLGYFYPEFFWEVDMEGGGVSVRGGSLSGIPNVLIGRGPDYGWSFTSSQSDNIDTFAETLCGDDHHYLYKGTCTAMTHFDAGVLHDPFTGDTPVSFWETVHGPVTGYGTVGGKRVALAQMRSTRGREIKAALDVYDLSTGRLKSAQQFTHDLSRFEMSFNGFYVDSKHIAYVSSGRLPIRAAGVDPRLPDGGHRRLRLDGLPRAGRAPAGDRSAERPARELEQQAGARLRGRRRQLRVRPDPPFAAPLAGTEGRQEHRARRGEHDEQGRDAGPARRHRVARHQLEARVDACAERARSRCGRSSTPGCSRAPHGSTGTATARSTIPARRSSIRRGRRSQTVCWRRCSDRSPTSSRR